MDGIIGTTPAGSCRIRRPDAPGNLDALLPLDHANVILTLQVQPELRAVAEVAAEPHGGIGRDRAAAMENVGDTAEGTPISSDRRFALSFRATISRFKKRPGCTTGAMAFNLGDVRRRSLFLRSIAIRQRYCVSHLTFP
jgi:hypothetical protein